MDNKIQEMGKRAYMEDRLNECPDWKPSELSDALIEDLEGFLKIFARICIEEGYKPE